MSQCGDLLLLVPVAGGDPVLVFNVAERRVLWERDLRPEIVPFVQGVADRKSAPAPLYCASPTHGLIMCGKTVFGVSLLDGRILWHRQMWVASLRPMMREERAYLWVWDPDGRNSRFVCFDVISGESVYDRPLADLGDNFRALEAWPGSIDGEHIAFGSTRWSGVVGVFRLSDGALVWSYKHKAEVYEPALVGNFLLVPAGGGKLLVFEGSNGAP